MVAHHDTLRSKAILVDLIDGVLKDPWPWPRMSHFMAWSDGIFSLIKIHQTHV